MRVRVERWRSAQPRSLTALWMFGAVSLALAGSGIARAGDAGALVLAATAQTATIEQLSDVPMPGLPASLSGLERGPATQDPGVASRPMVANIDPSANAAPPSPPASADARAPAKVSPVSTPAAIPVAFPAVAPVAEWVPVGTFPFDEAKASLKAALERFVKSAPGASRYRFAAVSPLKHRESIARFYAEHDYGLVWIANGDWNAAAHDVLEVIAQAAEDGLDVSAYPVPATPGVDPDSRLRAELALSEAVAAYGFQASGGRIDASRLSLLISAKPVLADAAAVLGPVIRAAAPGQALRDFNPPQPEYAALREKLGELRGHSPVARTVIPFGPPLRIGMRDPRVSLIRARFGLSPGTGRSRETYDTVVASAVADFQRANGLPASGVLTVGTVAALSGTRSSALVNEIIANMERWRWMPREMGSERIEVNIPDYALKVYRDGEVVHESRVIVGKPDTPTPIFSDQVRYLTVNPSWYVPQSIIQKELLPRASINPSYLTRLGYEVFRRGNTLIVRQPPGDRNALGHVLFMFPNKYAVYLHDTPARGLFGAPNRAFSHGCVRVDQPLKLAEIVLGTEAGWTQERLRRLFGPREKTISLPKSVPIHLTYFTALVDTAGEVRLRNDLYGYSKRVRMALGLEG